MARLIWLHDGGKLLRSVRLACQMSEAQFGDALGAELGWLVPASLVRAWERGRGAPPRKVLDVARIFADMRLTEVVGRREFLRRYTAMAGLTTVGLGAAANRPRVAPQPVSVRGRLHRESLVDLEAVLTDYRRGYGGTSAEELLPRACGLVHVLTDLQNASQSSAVRHGLTSLLGQAALLAGVVSLMGPHDLASASSYYNQALTAAREVDDTDLATYVTGSLSFLDTRAGRLTTGLERITASLELADERTSPMTRAWLASLASELHARAGHDLDCRRLLELAERTLDEQDANARPWKGVGVFDRSKLVAYHGGDLVLLASTQSGAMANRSRAREAETLLVDALTQLDPSRVKHRCTALGDIAMALSIQEEVEQACTTAGDALDLALQLGHAESVGRVQTVHTTLQRWPKHAAVRALGERLALAAP